MPLVALLPISEIMSPNLHTGREYQTVRTDAAVSLMVDADAIVKVMSTNGNNRIDCIRDACQEECHG